MVLFFSSLSFLGPVQIDWIKLCSSFADWNLHIWAFPNQTHTIQPMHYKFWACLSLHTDFHQVCTVLTIKYYRYRCWCWRIYRCWQIYAEELKHSLSTSQCTVLEHIFAHKIHRILGSSRPRGDRLFERLYGLIVSRRFSDKCHVCSNYSYIMLSFRVLILLFPENKMNQRSSGKKRDVSFR